MNYSHLRVRKSKFKKKYPIELLLHDNETRLLSTAVKIEKDRKKFESTRNKLAGRYASVTGWHAVSEHVLTA